jgi:hypothetical protein
MDVKYQIPDQLLTHDPPNYMTSAACPENSLRGEETVIYRNETSRWSSIQKKSPIDRIKIMFNFRPVF